MADKKKQGRNVMTGILGTTPEELSSGIQELREQLFKLRWQAASGQLDNPSRIKQVRRDIARHLTVLRQRELAAGTKEA